MEHWNDPLSGPAHSSYPVIGSVPLVDVKTVAYRSPNEEDAKVESVRRCESEGKGRSCTVIYS
ncbi:hypothetical protein U5F72_21710, partial [Stenotrophomonas muris]|nr:hypothetical protein [Stenotrophomonas muris]